LLPNVDFSTACPCNRGVLRTPTRSGGDNGHGPLRAGTIAGPTNGKSYRSAARPTWKLAGIRPAPPTGLFPEGLVCAFCEPAPAPHPTSLTTATSPTPWLFNCRNDPGQRAIWEAERRANRFAPVRRHAGVSARATRPRPVDPTVDATSPEHTTASDAGHITNACSWSRRGASGGRRDCDRHLRNSSIPPTCLLRRRGGAGGDSILQLTAAAPDGGCCRRGRRGRITTVCAGGPTAPPRTAPAGNVEGSPQRGRGSRRCL